MEFIGHKGAALFDLWSISHLLLGVALGAIPVRLARALPQMAVAGQATQADHKADGRRASVIVLLFALSWEALEYTMEAGSAGEGVRFWLQGHEHWLNRLISDPLLVLLGYQLSRWQGGFVWPARGVLLLWGLMFLFVLPHSMAYLG